MSTSSVSKSRIEVDDDLLSFLKPFLSKGHVETFIDWFYDTPDKDLASKNMRLRCRKWYSLEEHIPSDRWSFHPKRYNSIKENEDLMHLPGRYHHAYCDVYTKRYHLFEGLYVDFVGDLPYDSFLNGQDVKGRMIYAVCTVKHSLLSPEAKDFLQKIQKGDGAKSKNEIMLAYYLLGRSVSHLTDEQFQEFDHYLGMTNLWKNFPSPDNSDDEL